MRQMRKLGCRLLLLTAASGFVGSGANAEMDCAGYWEREMVDPKGAVEPVPAEAEGLYLRYAPGSWHRLSEGSSNVLPAPGTPCVNYRIGKGNPLRADGGIFVVKVERFYGEDQDPALVKGSIYLDRNATPMRKQRWNDDVFRRNYTNYHAFCMFNSKLQNGFHISLTSAGTSYRTDSCTLRTDFLFPSPDNDISQRTVLMIYYQRPDTERPTDIPFYFGREASQIGISVELVNLGDLTSGEVPHLEYRFAGDPQ